MGFRPCLRCRPELAPGLAQIDATSRVARAAAARIAEGALNEHSLDVLAQEFSITARQLRRVVEKEVGASPIALAQTHRLLLAKRLLTDTSLSMTKVAFASGFQSVRRFDALFQQRYRLAPSRLRKRATDKNDSASNATASAENDAIVLTLGYRPPFAWKELLAFLAARATPGVEFVEGDAYTRTLRLDSHAGWVRVQPTAQTRNKAQRIADRRALRVEISAQLTPVLMPLLAKLRHFFDLDANPFGIDAHLVSNGLSAHVNACGGLRVPGSVDGFELALRAVLGQQVSVKGATTLAGRFAMVYGDAIETPFRKLSRTAPRAERVAGASLAELSGLGITRARAECVLALAKAVAAGALVLEPGSDVTKVVPQLLALPGVGEWTAQYIAMRALRWPDGFPASDLWLRRAAGSASAAKLIRLAEAWRPWRAYAAMHLWQGIGAGRVVSMPE
jgi:AraC family transcriptional regulator of adaptative response / DNA-3-methyladenine glycosylase II